MKNKRFLFIDPSGSGTTGLFFYNVETGEEFFSHFKSKEWQEHFVFIKNSCLQMNVEHIVYETTNFIKIKGLDLTKLFKLFGAIETLGITTTLDQSSVVKKCETVLVSQVKGFYKKLVSNELEIRGISLIKGRGKGWFRNGKKIEIHELDAFLISQLFFKRETIVQSISPSLSCNNDQ